MDRITDQSPRQRGYGSTSSLRNDSLKHTQKHERRTEEPNQETKQSRTGGLSGQAGRIVRKGRADCPAGYRGLSAPCRRPFGLSRGLSEKGNRTSSDCPRITNRPPGPRGPSARHGQSRKLLDPEGQLLQSIIGSPKRLKLLRQEFGNMKSVNQECYTQKISPPNFLKHRESRILWTPPKARAPNENP
jgi:hypothetical protein